MSRDGGGVYTLPAGYLATGGATATAAQHNDPLEDLATDANTARPIVAGGTGATTAAAARSNLGIPISQQTGISLASLSSVTFSGIPSGINRLTVGLVAAEIGEPSSSIRIRLGDSGGIETTGYKSGYIYADGATVAADAVNSSFYICRTQSGVGHDGQAILTRLSGNIWGIDGGFTADDTTSYDHTTHTNGTKTLSGELTQLQVFGIDAFSAGTAYLAWEY